MAELVSHVDFASFELLFSEARDRQNRPGSYALLHANGMKWIDLVALISSDAIMTSATDEEY